MTAALSVYGRLGQPPKAIETRTGTSMVAGSLAVQVGEESTWWVGVVAFGKVADDLLRHEQGDLLSVAGRVQLRQYQTRAGEDREQVQVIADALVSAKSVRPRGGRRKHTPEDYISA